MPTRSELIDVSVEVETDSAGRSHRYALKISGPVFEVNVRVSSEDIVKFEQIRNRPWVKGSLRIGESAGAPVFWSVDEDGTVSVMLGHDDETWDVAVSFPGDTIEAILQELHVLATRKNEA